MNKSLTRIFAILVMIVCISFSTLTYAETLDFDEVYLGGMPIGIKIDSEGLIITGKSEVVTEKGTMIPCQDIDLYPGDILVAIDDIKVKSIFDVQKVLNSSGKVVKISVLRRGEVVEYQIIPVIDSLNGQKRLGLSIREDVSGIGTVTYVRKDGRYGALGHTISDESGIATMLTQGSIYKASILSVVKGRGGKAGELQGIFCSSSEPIGTVDKNTNFGIFGDTNLVKFKLPTVILGSKEDVCEGKAYIYSTVYGDLPRRYEIEIQKVNEQIAPKEKSMIIKIVDQDLLRLTNGIVQGMSGSPIVQNGKLIGAVTHVFLSDSTRGYGIFIDWMINN